MRIGIDARMLGNTGIGRYLDNLLRHLARIDSRNEYLVFINQDAVPTIEQDNVTYFPLPQYVPLYSLREQYGLPFQIRKRQPDIMYYPNFSLPLFQSCPYIVTIHDLIYYLYPDQCPSRAAHYYARFMIGYAAKHARIVLTDSQHSKNDLLEHFHLPPDNIHVVFPAADPRCVQSPVLSERMLQERFGLTAPYILYVGKHHSYKNIRGLIEAYLIHSDITRHFQLVIAGRCDLRQQDMYDMARNQKCAHQIVFTDFIEDDALFALYKHARLFVFPSLYEGFGLPPLEAMACGVPVVCSSAASLPEVVGDAALQFDPSDSQALAEQMKAVLTTPTLWKNLREEGLKRAERFSWEDAARQVLQIYTSL
ncbi:hypothetical protein CSA56_17915 [candidate division KSB3 bacterium]|uniref:Glycosyl transferase family 1 n=1 Tax=candidate division KSB3 bacterium TaxID=2044937 RepID=A0A2G6K858_9BACT|nr:MAG: hypothetical protein CSA56_17915 [candidate division KSB3 bacterium]